MIINNKLVMILTLVMLSIICNVGFLSLSIFDGLFKLNKLCVLITLTRLFMGFIILTFIPGLLLLAVLFKNKMVRNIYIYEIIIYSLGLSLSILMFLSFFMNEFFPLLSIPNPISEKYLTSVIVLVNITTSSFLLFYVKERHISIENRIESFESFNFNYKILYPIAIGLLIFTITILGALKLKYCSNNTYLILSYILISVIPFVAVSKKLIPEEGYVIILWFCSISLLFSVTLSINYITYYQGDTTLEYYFANLVYQTGIWNKTVTGNFNALLRIVLLHPLYARVLKISLLSEFVIIHPILYSFTPIGAYAVYYRLFKDRRIAFLLAHLFISVFSFYMVFSRSTRTGIAELFVILIALTILLYRDGLERSKSQILILIFLISIIVSHYGTAYVFALVIFVSILLCKMLKLERNKNNFVLVDLNIFLVYLIFIFLWYFYTSSSSPFRTLIDFLIHVFANVYSFVFIESYTLYSISYEWPLSIEVVKNLMILFNFFITIGAIISFWKTLKGKHTQIPKEFIITSASFLLIIFGTLLPTRFFNPARLYHISLVFLTPFLIIGINITVKLLEKIYKIYSTKLKYLKIKTNEFIVIFIIVYLFILSLFSLGIISELITKNNDYPPNILITKPRANTIHDNQYILSFYWNYFSGQDVISAAWLSSMRDNNLDIYSDRTGIFYSFIGPHSIIDRYKYSARNINVKSGYIYLAKYNVERKIVILQKSQTSTEQSIPPMIERIIKIYGNSLSLSNKIYTNGGSEIYLKE